MKSTRRIAVLSGGGDCPGLDVLIRSVAHQALSTLGASVVGILDGFEGLVEGRMREFTPRDVAGAFDPGGIILGTSDRGDPFHFPVETAQGIDFLDCSENAIKNYRDWNLDALIALGGDRTMHVVDKMTDLGLNVTAIPKTICNDLSVTDVTFGYDSAVAAATEAIDRLHMVASACHRVMIVEVTGRTSGWIALGAGLAGGADVILIPEIPFRWQSISDHLLKRASKGHRFSIICVAEGAAPAESAPMVPERDKEPDPARFRSIGQLIGQRIEGATSLETRVAVLGQLQRCGNPTSYDRVLAHKLSFKALELVRESDYGQMVSVRGTDVTSVPVGRAILKLKTVPPDSQMVHAARAVGTSFGD